MRFPLGRVPQFWQNFTHAGLGQYLQPVHPPLFPGSAGTDQSPLLPKPAQLDLEAAIWIWDSHYSWDALPAMRVFEGVHCLGGQKLS